MTDRTALEGFPARYFAAWHGEEASAFDEILGDAFTWVDPSLPAPLTSSEGVHDFYSRSRTSFPDLHFDPLGSVLVDEEGGRVAAMWRMTGTHLGVGLPPDVPATGKGIDVIGTDVFQLDRQGRATDIRACYDAMTLAAQLGLLG